MASEMMKVGISAEDLQKVILTWKRANDSADTQARLSADVNKITLRANGTAYIFAGEDAAKVFLPVFDSEDVAGLFVTPVEKKCYSANLHNVKMCLGMTAARPRSTSGDTSGTVSTRGKSEVERIDAAIMRLDERIANAQKMIDDAKAEVKTLQTSRPAAVKAEQDAKAAKVYAALAEQEAQAAALQAVIDLDDAALDAKVAEAAEAAKIAAANLAFMRKAIAQKRQTVNA